MQFTIILGAPLSSLKVFPISVICSVTNPLCLSSYLHTFKCFKLVNPFLSVSNWFKERGPEYLRNKRAQEQL